LARTKLLLLNWVFFFFLFKSREQFPNFFPILFISFPIHTAACNDLLCLIYLFILLCRHCNLCFQGQSAHPSAHSRFLCESCYLMSTLHSSPDL
jgi:hypothetical protein